MVEYDDEYFKQYEDLSVQEIMLKDKPRMEAYRDAIMKSRSKIEGKIVLDVGSGTGILSVFCAQAGAKKVHAVEASNVATISKEIVQENGFSDVIEVHHCLLHDLELSEKVDVIVSEWMGFFLFHEGMLGVVIEARDRFLKPDGHIIPESADLWVAPCQIPKYFDFWENVCGVKMATFGKFKRSRQKDPIIMQIEEEDLLGEKSLVKSVVLKTVTLQDITEIHFKTLVPATKDGKYQGICLWFVVNFYLDDDDYLFLTTSPGQPKTHWKQTVIMYPFEILVSERDPIAFGLIFRSCLDNPKKYNIEIMMLDPEKEEHPVPCHCSMTKCVVIERYLKDQMRDEDLLEDCEEDAEEDSEDVKQNGVELV